MTGKKMTVNKVMKKMMKKGMPAKAAASFGRRAASSAKQRKKR